jgi:hypothetical protein
MHASLTPFVRHERLESTVAYPSVSSRPRTRGQGAFLGIAELLLSLANSRAGGGWTANEGGRIYGPEDDGARGSNATEDICISVVARGTYLPLSSLLIHLVPVLPISMPPVLPFLPILLFPSMELVLTPP